MPFYYLVKDKEQVVSFGVAIGKRALERDRELIECILGKKLVLVGRREWEFWRAKILAKDKGKYIVRRRDLNGCCRCRG
jgi:hypothetical protein